MTVCDWLLTLATITTFVVASTPLLTTCEGGERILGENNVIPKPYHGAEGANMTTPVPGRHHLVPI